MLSPAIRQILFGNSPKLSFDLPLLTSLIPRFAAGSYTPTFTRATTATVTDFEGLLRTVKAGEARFEGARRVANLLSSSVDVSGWSKVNGATVTGINQINLANRGCGGLMRNKIIDITTIPILETSAHIKSKLLPNLAVQRHSDIIWSGQNGIVDITAIESDIAEMKAIFCEKLVLCAR